MTLNLIQKIQLGILRIILNFLGALDNFGYYLNSHIFFKKFLVLFCVLLLGAFGFIFYQQHKTALTGFFLDNSQNVQDTISSDTLPEVQIVVKEPNLIKKSAFPYITARSHLVIDNTSKKILSEHSVNQTFAPASTTKLMTALVALDLYNLQESIEIPEECTQTESTKLWLSAGSFVNVKDLIYSLLIGSAGDAACALATQKVTLEQFVDLMNVKANDLAMENTHFTNVVGLDGEKGVHYSTSWDLYLLSTAAMEKDIIRDAVKQKNYVINTTSLPQETFYANNTNKLLWEIENTVGVKTGTTDGAGEVLIYSYLKEDIDLTIIVMLSENRFADTVNLLNWALSSYSWE